MALFYKTYSYDFILRQPINKLTIYYEASLREKMETKKFVVDLLAEIMGAFDGKKQKKDVKMSTKSANEIIANAEEIKNKPYRRSNK